MEHFSLCPATSTKELRSGFGAFRVLRMHVVNARSTKKRWKRLGQGGSVEQPTLGAAVPRGNPDSAAGGELHGHIPLKLAGYSVVYFT